MVVSLLDVVEHAAGLVAELLFPTLKTRGFIVKKVSMPQV
jgi:hypothetical protein